MAARNMSHQQFTLERDLVKLFGRGTGNTTSDLTTVKGNGIASITRGGSAGIHTITLSDKWAGLLMFSACVIDAGTVDDWEVTVTAESVASAKTIAIQVLKGGAAADLPATAKLLFEITLSNTSQKPSGF